MGRPSLGLSLLWTVVAGAAGAMFGGLFVSLHASQGPRLGLPQIIQSRAQFGYRGVLIPVLIVVFNFMERTSFRDRRVSHRRSTAIFGHDWLRRMAHVMFWSALPFYVLLTIGMITGHAGEDV